MNADKLSWDALKAIHEHFREIAFALFDVNGHLQPMFFAVRADAQGRPLNLEPFPHSIMAQFFGGPEGKAAFSVLLPSLVSDTTLRQSLVKILGFEPNIFVQVTEAWAAVVSKEEYETGNGTYELPSMRPDRTEAILIMLHMPGLTIPVMHKVVNEPTRHAVGGKFPTQSEVEQCTSGRMTMQDATGRQGAKH